MRIDKVYIEEFKNLRKFSIDLDESKMHTVLMGQNAAGKSNFIEAIVLIFRDLDHERETEFTYEIEYRCNGRYLKAIGGKNVKGIYQLYIGEKIGNDIKYPLKPLSKAIFRENKDKYLPKHVFSYYSGVSDRLLKHFDRHQVRFRDDLLKGIDHPIRRLFYARNIHSHFVLMSFFSFSDEKIQNFLSEYLNIIGLESVLFVFKEPNWLRNKNPSDFWGAKGLVRSFLEELWEISMAPIVTTEKIRVDFVKRSHQQQIYLYVSNQEKIQKLADKYLKHSLFFKILESTYVSDLIQEVRIKVKKRNINGDITFKELSEGEQQLLTVLGLIRFTKENESLFLLDEPDTHLNPLWKWKYISLLEGIVDENDHSQILMTTHDPLVIGDLTKEEIRIFHPVKSIDENGNEYNKIETFQPDFDPKGIGVAGILTSEVFNLPTTLGPKTQNELNEYRTLEVLERQGILPEYQKEKLNKYTKYFESAGFNKYTRDPLYNLFIEKLSVLEEFKNIPKNEDERKKQDEIALTILEDLLKEEKE